MVSWQSIKMERATRCDIGESFWYVLSTEEGLEKISLYFFHVILTDKCGDMQHFVFWGKCTGSCYFITGVFFGIWKFFYELFVRRVHNCCAQSLVQIGDIAWEEFQKTRFATFCELAEKTVGVNGRGLYHDIQHNSVNVWIKGLWMCDKVYVSCKA